MSIEKGFKIIGLWFLLASKAKYLAKYSFLTEVILLKAGEGFKIAVHHHLDQPIMSIQELDLSPGSVFQVCHCRLSIRFLQGIISSPKGQLISQAVYGQLTSPKKRTGEFVLFAFLLFTANKSNSSVHFLRESKARQSAFWFYLTFRKTDNDEFRCLFFSLQLLGLFLPSKNCGWTTIN